MCHFLLCLPTFPTYYSHFLHIAHTLLSALFPLSYLHQLHFYVWSIPYYFHRRHFYNLNTLRPYLISVQLLSVFTRKYDTNCIDFASYLLHSHIAYKRSIPFHSFAICFTLIIFSFSSTNIQSTPLSTLFPPNNLKASAHALTSSKPKPS